jgi:putative ubiquitin-RnfH superfamily antitoxin RatB of RatAB toxin-antitoxin module
MANTINGMMVEVIYALPEEQTLFSVNMTGEATVKDVILQSKILDEYSELDIEAMDVGLFGKATKMDQAVRDKDRIEIYRPLIADPKEVRKRKAAEGKQLKKGGAEAPENKTKAKSKA